METLNERAIVAVRIVSGYAEPELASIGDNLKRLRGEEDQKVVAARMGIPQARLSNLEKNRYRTVTVRTLLWLAKGYRCSVEQIVQGLDAEYDASRDLLGQGGEYKSAPSQEVADVSASTRVRKLQGRIEQFESLVPEIKGVLTKLANIAIAAHEQDRPARRAAPGGRGRHRRAG